MEDKICGAKTRAGGLCQRAPTHNGRCHLHGGKSLAGAASPRFKHGRYSKYLPARLVERCEQAQEDQKLLELRDEIALVDARIADLLLRVDNGESGQLWQELQRVWQVVEGTSNMSDKKAAEQAIAHVGMLMKQGHEDYAAWDEVLKAMEHRRRLVRSELKYVVLAGHMIPVEEALTVVQAMAASVKRHVTDEQAIAAIHSDMHSLLYGGHSSTRSDKQSGEAEKM